MNEEQIKVWREEAMKSFSDNYLSSENIAPISYLKGFLAAKTSSYERDGVIAEMKILKKENALLYRSYNKVCDEINRGEHLDFEWIRGIIQDEVTHPVIDASVKVVDSYRRKIDELKEELKSERDFIQELKVYILNDTENYDGEEYVDMIQIQQQQRRIGL